VWKFAQSMSTQKGGGGGGGPPKERRTWGTENQHQRSLAVRPKDHKALNVQRQKGNERKS